MRLVEILEGRKQALRVGEVASLFRVTPQHIYRMAASGALPSLRIAGSVRFDPQDLANWLKERTTRPKDKSVKQKYVLRGGRRENEPI